jgi:hypothetical protein
MRIGENIIAIKGTVPAVIARGGTQLIFECGSVTEDMFAEFDGMVSEPQPPESLMPGGVRKLEVDSPDYLKAMDDYKTLRFDFIKMKSLLYTPGLTFDTVIEDKPETWSLLDTELRASGIMPIELTRIYTSVFEAQGISQEKIDAATASFLKNKQAAPTA